MGIPINVNTKMDNLNHVFTIYTGELPPVARETIARNKFFLGLRDIEFKVLPFEVPTGKTILETADRVRFQYAADNENVFYLDWDCLLIDFPVLNPDYAAFPFTDNNGDFDYFCFYSGNNRELFEKYLYFHDNLAASSGSINYWYSLKLFFKGRIQNIAPPIYKHYSLRGWLI